MGVGGTKRKHGNLTDEGMDDFDETEEINVQKNPEVENALRLSKRPIREVAKLWNLAPFLVKNLEEDEYDTFFPIQALVIPDVIASERHAHIRNRDVCVSAPTGSGKTLSFVLPVLNSLAGRRVRRLRALVVLPSRDLGKCREFVLHILLLLVHTRTNLFLFDSCTST
jgi:superfamily II DNA/RNA helicase